MLPGVPRTYSFSCRSDLFVSHVHGTASTRHERSSPAFCTKQGIFRCYFCVPKYVLAHFRFEGTLIVLFLESLPGTRNVTICLCVATKRFFFVHQYVPFFAKYIVHTARICACAAMHPPTVCLDFVRSHIRFISFLRLPGSCTYCSAWSRYSSCSFGLALSCAPTSTVYSHCE